jgi:Tfp pilus assembly protein FimT
MRPPTPPNGSLRPPHAQSQSGFSLTELVFVIFAIVALLSVAAPSITSVMKGKKIDQAITSVTATLELARSEARAKGAFVWVAFAQIKSTDSESGNDEVWMSTWRVHPDGTRPVDSAASTKTYPRLLSSPKSVDGIVLSSMSGFASGATRPLVDSLAKYIGDGNALGLPNFLQQYGGSTRNDFFEITADVPQSPLSFSTEIRTASGSKKMVFPAAVCFTPRGECLFESWDAITKPDTPSQIVLGFTQSIGNFTPLYRPDSSVIIAVSGSTGRVKIVRL